MAELTFYFDFVSNNAYLAWTQLPKLMEEHPVTIKPVPILFAGLLNAHGNVGPAEIPAKRDWMLQNILRKCALLDVPMAPPLHHPFDPLLALRTTSLDLDDDKRWQLIDQVFKAVWVRQLHVSDPQVMIQLANEIDLDGASLIERAQQAGTKLALRQQTEQAVSQGIFGIPSMVWKEEVFFGYDDFPFLGRVIDGKELPIEEELERWSMTPMSASSHRRLYREKHGK